MSDDYEIIVFDTIETHPHGFDRVEIHMTNEVNRDPRPSWMPQWRPCVVVRTSCYGDGMSSHESFGLKNIDGCLFSIGKNVSGSFIGYGAQTFVEAENVKRIVGEHSKFNSAERDFNTGRITIELKDEG